MSHLPQIFAWVLLLLPAATDLTAGVTLKGTAFDGAASTRALREAITQGSQEDELGGKVPLAQREIKVDLVGAGGDPSSPSRVVKTWTVTTDADGGFVVETELPQWPEVPLFVARAATGTEPIYSPYLAATEESQDVHLYSLTASAATLTADQMVVFDVHKAGDMRSLRVRARLSLQNFGGEMYVGGKTHSAQRELWRIPLPEGAVVHGNTSPYPGIPGWTRSKDEKWLILDTPIPGLPDFIELFKRQREVHWEVEYHLSPRQRFVQVFPVSLKTKFTAWCVHEDMSLSSPQLPSADPTISRDPLTKTTGAFDVIFSQESINPGTGVALDLTIDNAAIGQAVSLRALWWVGGFVLVVVLAVTLGLALGPKGPPPQALYESLSGEEVLDRIADLDGRFARGEIREHDYHRYREPLVELAAEEGTESKEGDAKASDTPLSSGVKRILERIDEIEEQGLDDPARITERAHLLEALAKALRSRAPAG